MSHTAYSLLLIICLLCASCAEKKETTDAQNIFLTPEIMCGTVEFTDGCGESTDTLIRFGLALLHHMTYEDAAYTFDQVTQKDPDCFWGPWGKAMSYIHPLWPDVPTEAEMESGYVLSQRALTLAKNDKEKLYGEALASYYVKSDKNKAQRLADFQQGWAKTTAQLPDDPECALFNGLFRLAIVSPADKSYTVQREVGEMAEGYLQQYPDHPGAFHYGIHAYDVPPLAPRALALARTYGKIAPEIPHALHMPSHIFTRLGYWKESIDWNSRSAVAAAKLPYDGQVSPHMFHALDYKVYAHLQLGEDDEARMVLKNLDTIKNPILPNAASAYALAAMPARIPLENQLWADAAKVEIMDTSRFPWKKFPQWEALLHYARGIGGARSGNADIADASITRLRELQSALGTAPQTKYWYDQMEAQIMAIQGWKTFASGQKEEGLTILTQAADLEDGTTKNPVSPGELLPARELLGDMLLELNRPKDALMAYEQCLESRPNRFNSLYGAGRSAEASQNMEKAKLYYTNLLELTSKSNTNREQLKHARNMLKPA